MWRWLIKAGAAVVGVLAVWLQIVTGQRDRARQEAARERERADIGDRARAGQRDREKAQQRAREAAQEAARDEDDRRKRGDRTGGLGNERLRDE